MLFRSLVRGNRDEHLLGFSTSQVHVAACIEAVVGSALFRRPCIDRSQPPVFKDFVMQGGSHVALLLDCVVTSVICTYVCTATVFMATATVSMDRC